MEYQLAVIKVSQREQAAPEVQRCLTEFGCNIKVRLGLHDLPADSCTPSGLIVLELAGEQQGIDSMLERLNSIDGVFVQYLRI